MFEPVALGRLLVDTGVVTQETLDGVVATQGADGRRLGEMLVERGLVHPYRLAQLLSHQMSCPWISLANVDIAEATLAALPSEVALAHRVVPVHFRNLKSGRVLYVATDDPTDESALDACAQAAGMPVRAMVAVTGEIRKALARIYEGGDGPPSVVERLPAPQPSLAPPPRRSAPVVLALAAPPSFAELCARSIEPLGGVLVQGDLEHASALATKHRPCALVVTDETFAESRAMLSQLAIDEDAILVVWSAEAEQEQLDPLLTGAVKRWRRAAYEKGATVDDRYELLRELEGPSAISRWEVCHVRTGRRAILEIGHRDGRVDGAKVIARVAHALSVIAHPGAVDLRDAGQTSLDDPYIVLEPIEGRSLEGLVLARGTLPVADACAVVYQLAEVLQSAHALRIVHGDVSLENVVLTRDGYGAEHAKLVGWGASRTIEDDAELIEAIGKDVRALGHAAFVALVGREPREGDAELPGLPPMLSDVLVRATGTGYPRAMDLADAIVRTEHRARKRSQLLAARRERRSLPVAKSVSAPPAMPRFSVVPQDIPLDVPPPVIMMPGPIPAPAPPPPQDSVVAPKTSVDTPPTPRVALVQEAEQRRFPRAPYRTPVRVAILGKGAVDGRVEDVSIGGVLLVTRESVTVGTEVTMRFALPLDGKVVSETGVVCWSRAARGDDASARWALGVAIAELGGEALRQIERYVGFMGDGTEVSFDP